ncbi:MAG: T9SS type A sorting domain-containing protein [Saprospiraceae bacterium]|nr:T9SS type A sorting domain-containing protein [Saprospiraceae bacterium]
MDSIHIEDNSTVGISDPDNLKISLYPNPASGIVHIVADGFSEFQVTVYNLDGRKIRTYNGVEVIDVSDVGQGVYIVKIKHVGGYSIQRLVVRS